MGNTSHVRIGPNRGSDVELHSLNLGMVGEKVLTFKLSENLGGELPVLVDDETTSLRRLADPIFAGHRQLFISLALPHGRDFTDYDMSLCLAVQT